MAHVLVTEQYLTDIADSIRSKLDTQDTYKPSEMAGAIVSIEGSSWTKIAETECAVNTTNSTPSVVLTYDTGHPEIWTADKILYVRIRDKAGKRNGYFYGTDLFFSNVDAKNENAESAVTIASWNVIIWTSSTGFSYRASQFGVFPWMLHNDGKIDIGARYNVANSGTIDGTYLVEVYLLDPTGPIFE